MTNQPADQPTPTNQPTNPPTHAQGNLEKVRSEVRYEVDKLTASQRLDLNLEKGRMRDELQALRDREAELDSK